MKLRIIRDITGELKKPIMLAGWHGMGRVGLGALTYIRNHLKTEPFLEIDTSEYVTPDEVVVENGLVEFPELPLNTFSYCRDPELLIFESDTQIRGAGGISLMNQILDLAEQHNVKTIFTGAAFAMPISHREPVQVYGVANRKSMRDTLIANDIKILKDGEISGLNGLLLGFAGLRNIKAACFLATMPQYAINLPNPGASRALVRVFMKLIGFKVDLREIDEGVAHMNESMARIESKMQTIFSEQKSREPEEDWKKVEEDKVPEYVMEKIERLFSEVQSEHSREKATLLKNELDKWNLFGLYEDRFLSLFR